MQKQGRGGHSLDGSGDAPYGLSRKLRPPAQLPQQLLRLRLAGLRNVERRRPRGRGIDPLSPPPRVWSGEEQVQQTAEVGRRAI